MSIYAATRKTDGAEVYRYVADAPIEWADTPFSDFDHVEVVNQTPVTLQQPRRMTKLAFTGLMTQQEFIDLLAAAKTNTAVEMFIKMIDWTSVDPDGTSIDRDDPRTIAGVRALFSPERADQILGVTQ